MPTRTPIGALASGALAVLIAAAILLLLGQGGLEGLGLNILIDTDGYLHAVRVKMMLAGEDPSFIARDNAPHGFYMHWSGLYDSFVYAFARAAIAVDPALLPYALGLSSPLTLALLCGTAVWALAPTLPPRGLIFAACLFACAYGLYGYGQIGRNDHHIFALLPFTVAFGAVLRVDGEGHSALWSAFAGALCGLALWITPETLPAVLLILGLFLATTLQADRRLRASTLTLPMLAVLGLGLLVDPPAPDSFALDIDRHSLIFLALAAALAAAALILDLATARLRTAPARIALAAGLGATALGGWLAVFPQILSGPESLLGADLTRLWWDQIKELKPVSTPGQFMSFAALGAAGALAALHRTWTERTLFWAVAALGAIGFLILTLVHVRFSPASNLVGILFIGLAYGRAAVFDDGEPRPFARVAATVLAAPFLSLFLLIAAAQIGAQPDDPSLESKQCTVSTVAQALETLPETRAIILSGTGEAPEILYRTHHSTIAGPYQRNVEGLRDVHAFLLAEDDMTAAEVLARRGVDYVLVCDRQPPKAYHDFAPNGLLMRIVGGTVPGWLLPVPWPAGTKTDLLLFRVAKDALPIGDAR